ncbi:MAG: TMEM165/GDT1 family protein [Methylobacter sp.]|uniref:TMEM165/GDT1 family protein n=1 Tax=Methylobacter sp. TaxID=2051955 RepID=UPI00272F054A|nr:TMEM165/GDT1 family protein [Methylobacter sp.]MDP1667028.1 TMEM165/GDT1 family protein [Methylobacter sp.]MDP1970289.1 TMEM165/GDT1 family protein [Methylobacter sp.]
MDHLQSYLQHLLASLSSAHLYENLQSSLQHFLSLLSNGNFGEISATAATSFALIAAAEIGDKSQLVCMTLASRHRAMPVLLGAISAFAFLNTLAVMFGIAIASWLPEYIVATVVAILFAAFGIHSLRVEMEDENEEVKEKSGHGIFFTTFLLITVAEFGDKTQLAVVGLSSTATPIAVWFGSTVALASTSALGILAGRTILKKVPLGLLHKISGTIFLMLSVFAGYRAYVSYIGL